MYKCDWTKLSNEMAMVWAEHGFGSRSNLVNGHIRSGGGGHIGDEPSTSSTNDLTELAKEALSSARKSSAKDEFNNFLEVNGFTNSNSEAAGEDAGSGFSLGFLSGIGGLKDKAVNFFGGVKENIKEAFGDFNLGEYLNVGDVTSGITSSISSTDYSNWGNVSLPEVSGISTDYGSYNYIPDTADYSALDLTGYAYDATSLDTGFTTDEALTAADEMSVTSKEVAEKMDALNGLVERITRALENGADVVMYPDDVVGAIKFAMDKALGDIQKNKERGM